ncbi:MAG: phosphate butyryltransferase, partial [Prolixibacteraceae bacterium]|nr:phosphate butyryltransferase [Prolixibacteraceae bacterium]
MKNFKDLLEAAKKQPEKRLVAVNGTDENTLEALNKAVELGLVCAILTGDKGEIEKTCANLKIDINNYTIIHATSKNDAAEKAVSLIQD